MRAWQPVSLQFAVGLMVGLAGVGVVQLSQTAERALLEQEHQQLRLEWVGVQDQLRRFEQRWQAHAQQPPPEPLRPPPEAPPLDVQGFELRLRQAMEQNGLVLMDGGEVVSSLLTSQRPSADATASTPVVRATFKASLESALALLVQIDEAAASVRLQAWSVRQLDPVGQSAGPGLLQWQLVWQLGGTAPKQALAFVGVNAGGHAQLHNPFEVAGWWRREVDQAPMAKGASRRQWQKDMQLARHLSEDHAGPWQWLGWMGRREGRRAWVQSGSETLSVQVGQALTREPVVVESMDAIGLQLRRWALNAEGRWQVVRESAEWMVAE